MIDTNLIFDIIDRKPVSNKPINDNRLLHILFNEYKTTRVESTRLLDFYRKVHDTKGYSNNPYPIMGLFYSQIIHLIDHRNNYINKRLDWYLSKYKNEIEDTFLDDILAELYLVIYDFIESGKPGNPFVHVSDKLAMRLCSFYSKNQIRTFRGNYKLVDNEDCGVVPFDNYTLSKRTIKRYMSKFNRTFLTE